jgi:hypothetical protein
MDDDSVVFLIIGILLLFFFVVRKVESYDDPMIKRIHDKLIKVDVRAKNLSVKASSQSFTEDKKRTYLCLRNEQGEYYDENMLMYVALHELAHAISKQVDTEHRTDEFRDNFKLLLKKAESLGYYDPSLPLEYNYCKQTPAILSANSGPPQAQGGVIEINA